MATPIEVVAEAQVLKTSETEVMTLNACTMNETTAGRIAKLVTREEFRALSRSGSTIFLPSTIFPNNDRRVTIEESNMVFDTLHLITGRVCSRDSEEDQRELHCIVNSILDEARRYTRSRICQQKDVEACQHWEWRMKGRIVESYADINEVLKCKWTTNRATMIQQCHDLMHGMYQTKKSIGWFSQGLQGFLDLKRIQLYKTNRAGERVILERNDVGRLLSFAKQARAKINRDRNSILWRCQGIQIFSGKRGKLAKNHHNRTPVNKYDGGCDGYYIDNGNKDEHAKNTLATLMSSGHTNDELIEMLNKMKTANEATTTTPVVVQHGRTQEEQTTIQRIEDGTVLQHNTNNQANTASIPKTVEIQHRRTKVQGSTTEHNLLQTSVQQQTKEEYEAEGRAFINALRDNGKEKDTKRNDELDTLSLDLQTETHHLVDERPTAAGLKEDKSDAERKKNSPTRNNDNASSSEATDTDVSSAAVSPTNLRQKNMIQLKNLMKPKPKPKNKQKKKGETKEPKQGTRRSPRGSPSTMEAETKGNKKMNSTGKTSTARRALQV